MTTTAVADVDQLAIVKLLASGMGLGLVVAANRHLDEDLIREVAHAHGYPEVNKLRWSAEILAGKADPDVPPTAVTAPPPQRARPEPKARPGMFDVDVADLHPSPANPRERMTDIEGLAASIREAGLIQPIVAQRLDDGTLQIVAGHRRHAAVKMLGWQTVPVIVRKAMLPDAELVTMLVENGQRANLDPIEEARALNHLKVTGKLTDSAVAKKVGRSVQFVGGRIALLSLPWEEQEAIRNGTMTLTEAGDKARVDSGRIRPGAKGRPSPAHLSISHPLGPRAKARCQHLGHSRGRGTGVGGIACGACWEHVIRADEREGAHAQSSAARACIVCGSPYGATSA